MAPLLRLFLTALLLFGAAPLSYGNVPPLSLADAGLGELGTAAARGVGHAAVTEAVYGGRFGDVLKKSLVSEASAASFEFIGHELKTPENQRLNLPEATVLHAMVGGALAQISGGDFTTGAIATATSHVVAEQVKSHYLNQVISGEMSLSEMEGKVTAISRLVGGAAAIAVNPDISPQELSAAQAESASVAQNNSLKLIVTAAKIGKRLYEVERKLKRAGKKLGKADIKKVLKEEGLDIVGDVYTFIDPEAGVADMAWAAADLLLGTGFNNRAFAVAKKFGKGKQAKAGDVVIGPMGGKAVATGKSTSDGRPIYKRESGGYYTVDAKTGKQVSVNSPNEHGNVLGDQPAELYKLTDRKTGEIVKIGETTHGEFKYGAGKQRRYSRKELDNMTENGVIYTPIDTGTKKAMYDKQGKLIKRFRSIHGEDALPKNINGR